MKQHITTEQLNEIIKRADKKAAERLFVWVNKKDYFDIKEVRPFAFTASIPLLSIGQMIEFLFDNDFGPTITSNDMAFYWIVEPEKKLICWSKEEYLNSELVDALWEPVKEILNK